MARYIAVAALVAMFGLGTGQGVAAPPGGPPPSPGAPPPPPPDAHTIVHAPVPFPGPVPPPGSCSAGFSARKSTSGTSTVRGSNRLRLRFQDVLTNQGGWSDFNSEFNAPCSGLYYFSFHAVAADGRDFTLGLMKNGQYQVTAYGGRGSFQQGSNSALLYLNRGDRVHLELQQGNLYEHPFNEAYTSFSGFLVQRF